MIYYVRCLCRSTEKLYAKQLQKQGVEIRVTKNNPEWRKEAAAYKTKLPFFVENGEVVQWM